MQIAKSLAGFSGAKADDLRKAIGKKNREAMAEAEARVRRRLPRVGRRRVGDRVAVADEREVGRLLVQQVPRRLLRADLLPHRLAEGQLPGRVHGGADLLGDGHEGQGPVLRRADGADGDRDPAAGRQRVRPRVHGRRRRIRFGLDAVKGVGFAAVEAIKRAREEGGPFASLWDFCERVDGRAVNKKAIEALIKCGAFGSTGATRKGMLAVLEQAQAAGQKSQQDALDRPGLDLRPGPAGPGRRRRRANGAAAAFAAPSHPPIPSEEFEQAELLAVEKESIGLFVSAHPLKAVREAMRLKVDCSLAQLADRRDGEWVTVGGIITQAKKIRTKRGDHDDVRHARRSRGQRRDPRLRQSARRPTRRRSRSTRSCSCAARSTTRTPRRRVVIVQEATQIRADRGGDREGARAGARDPRRPAARAPAARRDRAAGERDRRPQAADRAHSGRVRRRARRCAPRAGRAG